MKGRWNKLGWLIGIPAIVLVLLKGIMHWQVSHKLGQLILEAAPRFTITYDHLDTSLGGSVDINDIRLVPVGQSEAFRITRISIQGPDAFTYLLNNNPLADDTAPLEYLNVFVQDLNLDLTGSLASNLDQNYQFPLQHQGAGIPAACDGSGNMSLSLLKDMGRDYLTGDGRLFYRYDQEAQRLTGSIELNLLDIQSMSIGLALENVSPHALKYGMPGMPWLADFRLTMQIDPEFGKEMSAYCADKSGKTVAEHEKYTAGMFMQSLADNGIELGWGLEQAVRSYYRDWGEIDIIVKPPTPLNILTLMLHPPENFEETLGLQVAVNDQLLTDLGFTLNQAANPFVSEAEKKKKAPAVRPRYRMVWKEIPPAQLMNYRDRRVRLHTSDRPVRKGVLIGVDGDVVLVEQRVPGGKFTAHVPMRKINRVEASVMVRTNPSSTPEKGKTE